MKNELLIELYADRMPRVANALAMHFTMENAG